MTTLQMKKLLCDSMETRAVVIVTYRSGISHRGWISECDASDNNAILMIDGRENHAIHLMDVFSVSVTTQFF